MWQTYLQTKRGLEEKVGQDGDAQPRMEGRESRVLIWLCPTADQMLCLPISSQNFKSL